MDQFTAGSCIRFGWDMFKKRPWFFIGAALFYFVVVIFVSSILSEFISQGGILALVATIARFAFQILVGMGAISFALKAHDDVVNVSILDFWRPRPFWKYTGVTVLFAVIFIVGLVLVIIPGIIWGITYGYKWELLLLGVLSILIAIVGAICLGVGLLVAYPVLILANAHAFRTLQQKAASSSVA